MSYVLVDLDALPSDIVPHVEQASKPLITCTDCKYNGTMHCKCILCDGNQYMSYSHPDFYCADAKKITDKERKCRYDFF